MIERVKERSTCNKIHAGDLEKAHKRIEIKIFTYNN